MNSIARSNLLFWFFFVNEYCYFLCFSVIKFMIRVSYDLHYWNLRAQTFSIPNYAELKKKTRQIIVLPFAITTDIQHQHKVCNFQIEVCIKFDCLTFLNKAWYEQTNTFSWLFVESGKYCTGGAYTNTHSYFSSQKKRKNLLRNIETFT